MLKETAEEDILEHLPKQEVIEDLYSPQAAKTFYKELSEGGSSVDIKTNRLVEES